MKKRLSCTTHSTLQFYVTTVHCVYRYFAAINCFYIQKFLARKNYILPECKKKKKKKKGVYDPRI